MSQATWVMCAAASVFVGCGEVATKLPGDAAPLPGDAAPAVLDADSSAPPSDGGQALTITLHKSFPFVDGDTENATFLAVQDGTGPWNEIAGDQGVYRVPLTSERYGVAYGCLSTTRSLVVVVHQTTSNGLEIRRQSCQAASLQLKVVVQNTPPDMSVFVAARGTSGIAADGSIVLLLNPGPTELFLTLISTTGLRLHRTIRMPAFELRANREVTVDVASAGVMLESHPLSVALPPDEVPSTSTTVITDTGAYVLFPFVPVSDSDAAKAFHILPMSLRGPADLFDVSVVAFSILPDNTFFTRRGVRTSKLPQTLTIELPDVVATPPPAILVSPYLRPAYSFANDLRSVPGSSYLLNAVTIRASDSRNHAMAITLSSEWLGDASSVEYITPDLSSIPGFRDGFTLFSRSQINWSVSRIEQNATTGDGHVLKQGTMSGQTGEYCGNDVIEPPETCEPPLSFECSSTCTKL